MSSKMENTSFTCNFKKLHVKIQMELKQCDCDGWKISSTPSLNWDQSLWLGRSQLPWAPAASNCIVGCSQCWHFQLHLKKLNWLSVESLQQTTGQSVAQCQLIMTCWAIAQSEAPSLIHPCGIDQVPTAVLMVSVRCSVEQLVEDLEPTADLKTVVVVLFFFYRY